MMDTEWKACMPTIDDYIPEDVLDEVLAVLRHGEVKHGEKWKTHDAAHHIEHAKAHIESHLSGNIRDEDFGTYNLANAACRILFALAKEMEK